MDERIRKYFLEQDYNCAEAMLHVLNEKYKLSLQEPDYSLVSGFGGGCGCGMLCGALAGQLAALGRMMVTERAHVTPDFKETCGALCDQFRAEVGSTDCAQLRPEYFEEGLRCSCLLEAADRMFESFLIEKGLA